MNSNFHPKAGLIALLGLLFMAKPALATSMTVVNSGFETGDLTGWSTVSSGGYGSGTGVINNVTNQSVQYPNFHVPLPGTAQGDNYGWVCGYTGNPAEILYQDVSANGQGNSTLQPNTTYILTVAIGEGTYSSPNNGYIALVNGKNPSGTVLATASISTLNYGYYADNFQDLTVTFTTGSTVSGDLTIEISTIYGFPTASPIYIDNVRLIQTTPSAAETIGGGTISSPALGPQPSFNLGGGGFTLVKNWHFGTNGTIPNIAIMSSNFQYHDEFGTINNGGNYGADIVAPDSANALSGQPIEGANTGGAPVRAFKTDSLQTYLVPLNGATTCTPSSHNAGNGSFQAKWTLPNGGSLLGEDILWETRVRYVTPPYFWFALWTAGNDWNNGAEMDLIESFGFNNGGGSTNYHGLYWHSNSVAGSDQVDYSNWPNGMASVGITSFDPTQYHIWTLAYNKDNTYAFYVDGIEVQHGLSTSPYWWTVGATSSGTPINLSFLFDAGWGHTKVASVNHSLAASAFAGCYYEWNYSRVYLRQPPTLTNSLPATTSIALGTAFNFTYQTSPGPAVVFSIASGSLPPGLTLGSTGVLSGTPTQAGTYTGTISASNGTGSATTQTFTITVLDSTTDTPVMPLWGLPVLGTLLLAIAGGSLLRSSTILKAE